MRPLVALALLAGFTVAAPVPKALKKRDAAVVGTWKPTDKESAWFQFAADGTLTTWHGEADKKHDQMNWTYALVPDGQPERMKLNRVPDSHNWYDCLYEIDGDTLKVVILLSNGMEPPKKVEAGHNLQLHQLTRHTPAK